MATRRAAGVVFLAAVLSFAVANPMGAAPVPITAPATDKWEYGEVVFGRNPARGVAAGQPAPPAQTAIRWVTSDDEVEAQSWEEMATKLKAPAAKMNLSPNTHKLRAFNQLGAEGWELVGHQKADTPRGTEVWTFKRKVKK
jgi:hypothetical protein